MRLAVLLTIPAALLAQGGIVEGTITNKLTHAGAPGVKVKIEMRGRWYDGVTDDAGTYRLLNVEPGEYTPSFDSHDFMTPSGLRPLRVASGGDPVRLDAELTPWAKIRGRVLDDQGHGVAHVRTEMMRLRGGGGSIASTKDDGTFEIWGMGAGTYTLIARPILKGNLQASKLYTSSLPDHPAEGERTTWATTYFPRGVDRTEAQPIIVREGADLVNYEIRLRVQPVFRLAGVALGPDGHPFAGATLKLIFDSWLGPEAEAKSGADGAFEFPAVRPGDWRIQAEGKSAGAAVQGAAKGTVTRRDVENAQVRLYPPFPVTGFVDREEPRDAKGERKVTGVFLEGVEDVLRASAFHEQDGRFTISAFPGRYRIVPMGFVRGYYVESVMLGERDVTNQEVELAPGAPPLRVNYKPNAGKVRGSVENCGTSQIYIVPQDESFLSDQFIRAGRCDSNGRFEVDSLRPGSYYAFAFDRVESSALSDPAFVRGLSARAETFQVKQGETASVSLKVTPWPE